jgi:Tol biopolymer transport system component
MNEDRRFGSWKEIGAYLERDARTVRRWEKEEGLPIHRHTHKKGSSVYAYRSEIDAWRAGRRAAAEPPPPPLWKTLLTGPRSLAFAAALALFLVMVGNGVRTQVASAQASQGAAATRRTLTIPRSAEIFGTAVSPDGRYIPFVDWAQEHHGDLFLHDFATGKNRRLTNTAGPGSPSSEDQFAEETSFSRDGQQLAYTWYDGKKDRYEIRVVNLESTGIPAFRRLFENQDVFWVAPFDWSPDGSWIAVDLHHRDRSGQIGIVNTRDGSLRLLKSVGWRGPTHMSFSLDSKYLVYDLAANDDTVQRDIFILAIDGTQESAAVVHPSDDTLAGWTPDGKSILFASDRRGSRDLWSLAVRDGKPAGEPGLVWRGLGEMEPLAVTGGGKLYSMTYPLGTDLYTASFDYATGRLLSPPAPAVQTFEGNNLIPDWSPDGKWLAYLSRRGLPNEGRFVIGIRSVATGKVRELALALRRPDLGGGVRWAADGRSLLTTGQDFKGRTGIFRIDAQSGKLSAIVTQDRGGLDSPVESPDGKSLFYQVANGSDWSIMKRDLASSSETALARVAISGGLQLSPNGRHILAYGRDAATKSNTLLLVPAAGGEAKELMRRQQPQFPAVYTWAPDSKSVLVRILSKEEKSEIWRVALDGSPAVKLPGTLETKVRSPRLAPDGKTVAFQMNDPRKPAEIWVTENFLPGTDR